MDSSQLQKTFDQLNSQFDRAVEIAGSVERRCFQFGENIVCFCFAGPALIPDITTAIVHCAIETDQVPDLTISIWESKSTGVPVILPFWGQDEYIVRREVSGMCKDGFLTTLGTEPGRLTMLNTITKHAVVWIEDGEALPDFAVATPLLPLFQQWFTSQGQQILHTAAVGNDSGAVLIVGTSGAGKSTTTMLCLQAGMNIVGEDYCLLSNQSTTPMVHSLFNIGKLNAESMSWMPEFESMIIRPARDREQKAMLRLYPRFKDQFVHSLPIQAILIPHITGKQDTSLSSATSAAGLHALAPSTIFQLSGAGVQALRHMAELVRRVPSYHIALGTDAEQIPRVIQSILSE